MVNFILYLIIKKLLISHSTISLFQLPGAGKLGVRRLRPAELHHHRRPVQDSPHGNQLHTRVRRIS